VGNSRFRPEAAIEFLSSIGLDLAIIGIHATSSDE